jgi:hypothetical protein
MEVKKNKMQQEDTSALIEILSSASQNLKEKLKEQKVFDPKDYFWKRYIELLDTLDEIDSEASLKLLAEANLLRVLSILAPYWQELKKQLLEKIA